MPRMPIYNRGRTVGFTYNLNGGKAKITHPNGESETISVKSGNIEDNVRSACIKIDNKILEALEKKQMDKDIAENVRIEEERRNEEEEVENDAVDSAIDVDPSPNTDSSSIPQP